MSALLSLSLASTYVLLLLPTSQQKFHIMLKNVFTSFKVVVPAENTVPLSLLFSPLLHISRFISLARSPHKNVSSAIYFLIIMQVIFTWISDWVRLRSAASLAE